MDQSLELERLWRDLRERNETINGLAAENLNLRARLAAMQRAAVEALSIAAEYDHEADALYVRLRAGVRQRAIEVDESTYIDVDAEGCPVGLEFLNVDRSADLSTQP